MGILAPRPLVADYDDLRVALERPQGDFGRVRLESRLDKAEGPLNLDLSLQQVEEALATASRGTNEWVTRSGSAEQQDPICAQGQLLFSALFEGRRAPFYARAFDQAAEQGKGLRLRLVRADPDLAALPWEFLHDGRDFLALSARSPVVRSLLPLRQSPPPITPPLRMLVVTADPTGQLNTDAEVKWLYELVSLSRDRIELEVRDNVNRDQFVSALYAGHFHALHFIGTAAEMRGGPQGLVLMPSHDQPSRSPSDLQPDQVLDGAELRHVLRDSDLRLVYFSACHTDRLAAEAVAAVPAAIGMRGTITDKACMEFVRGLYLGIGEGLPLEEAVTRGRLGIAQFLGSREPVLPVFHLQVEACRLFDGRPAEEPAPTLTAPEKGKPPKDPQLRRDWNKIMVRIGIQERNLSALQEQAAPAGKTAPDFVQKQIEEAQSEIDQLKQELARLGSSATEGR